MKNILLLIALFIVGMANAQPPAIEWQNTIGGSAADNLAAIEKTTDGGYVMVGYSYSNIGGDKTENSQGGADYWVVKINAVGVIQWQNTIGGSLDDRLYSIQQTFDGGYILGGNANSDIGGDKTENNIGGGDYWVVKLDAGGVIQWQNTIGGNALEILCEIRQTTDSGYVVGGLSASSISGDKTENSQGSFDYWVVKLDTGGVIQWQNTIGGGGDDWLTRIQQTNDNGYVVIGTSDSNIGGDKTENNKGGHDYWVVKLDTVGVIQWQKTIGGNADEQRPEIQQTVDSGYVLGCFTSSNISGDKTENNMGGFDYWVVKLDMGGVIEWQNTIGGSGADLLSMIKQTTDGGYVISGNSDSDIGGDKNENSQGGPDYWVVKINAAGVIQWQKTIGGSGDDNPNSIQQTVDGSYILAGSSDSDISGDKTENSMGFDDYWVVKFEPMDKVWPGDANSDLIANNLDFLAIGIGFGTNGIIRPNATLNWVGQGSADWIDTLITGVNYKHIDCNGDGIINSADTNAIIVNYGSTHTKTRTLNIASPADPDFYVEITPTTVPHNTAVTVDLMLGTVGVPADSIYGLAFTLNFNPLLVDSASMKLNVVNSWLGTVGTDMIKLDKKFYGNGQVDVGIVRIDQSNSTGNGKIGELNFTAVNNSPTDEVLTITISDVTVIANNESIRNVNLGADSVIVQGTVGINENSRENEIDIYPNPTEGKFRVESLELGVEKLEVFDVYGRVVLTTKEPEIDMRGFARGMYYVKAGEAVKKLILH